MALAEISPGDHVLEIGAGLGSLTVELLRAGARVVAVEVDGALLPALREAVQGHEAVVVLAQDACTADWPRLLAHPGPWKVVANLPYNVAVPSVMRILEDEPRVQRLLIMVQLEVGERLAASPGHPQYGALSLHVSYRAEASVIRKVPRSVFWPRPHVDSVLVSMRRRNPPVDVAERALWDVVDTSFAERRKTMRNALVRLGLTPQQALGVLEACGVLPSARPEELDLAAFACLAARRTSLLEQ